MSWPGFAGICRPPRPLIFIYLFIDAYLGYARENSLHNTGEPAHSFTAPPVSAAPSASEADLRAADRELNEAVQSIGVWHSMSPFAAQATVQPHVAPSLIQAMGVDSAEDLQAVRV